jgi:hypothetical protein
MKYPAYKQILRWIVENVNCEWIADEDAEQNILVQFLSENWEVEKDRIVNDLNREYKKVEKSS